MHFNSRIVLLFLASGLLRLSAEVALLVGEPYGRFGAFNPTGHAAVYLSRVCAATPTKLRMCGDRETGVVISRYNKVAERDWIAIPLLPYFYAVDRQEDVPASADIQRVAELRDEYRRRHLRELVPDGPNGGTPKGDWIQLVGSAYDRKIYGFALETTEEDDERLMEMLNSGPNSRRFNLFYRNCADFARRLVNFHYPGAIRRSIIADAGITTPKHSAKALARYARRRELPISHFEVPQISGMSQSTRLRGVNESLIRSRKYAVPLILLQPWVAASAAVAYLVTGRFDPSKTQPTTCELQDLAACVAGAGPTAYAGSVKADE